MTFPGTVDHVIPKDVPVEHFLSVPAFVRFRGLTGRAAPSLGATLGFCVEAPLLERPHAQETPGKSARRSKKKTAWFALGNRPGLLISQHQTSCFSVMSGNARRAVVFRMEPNSGGITVQF
jgi:hypothetical protein